MDDLPRLGSLTAQSMSPLVCSMFVNLTLGHV